MSDQLSSDPRHQLAAALRANIADPCNITWRRVLEALAAIEQKEQEEQADGEQNRRTNLGL